MLPFDGTRWAAAIAIALTIGVFSSCSERIAGAGDQRIDIEIRTSVGALGQTAQDLRFALTVTGLGIVEPVRADLSLSPTGLLAGSVVVPSGPARLFRIDAFDSSGTLIYSGRATADVPRDGELRLDIVLAPMVPMVKISPVYRETVQGDILELRILVHNLADIASIGVSVTAYDPLAGTLYGWSYWTSVEMNPDLLDLSDPQLSRYYFDEAETLHIRYVLRNLEARLVDEDGYAHLATVITQTHVYETPLKTIAFTPFVEYMTDKLGNELPPEAIHAERSLVLLHDYWVRMRAFWEMGSLDDPTIVLEQINNLDGTATGTSIVLYGMIGSARYFDGDDDYIEVPDDDLLDIRDEIGISMWINRSDVPIAPLTSLIGKRDANGPINYQLLIEDRSQEDGYVSFLFRYGGSTYHTYRADAPANILNGWFELAFSFRFGDPSSALFAVGGYEYYELAALAGDWITGNGYEAPPNTSGSLYIGKDNADDEIPFCGVLDEIVLGDIAWSLPVIQYYSIFGGWGSRTPREGGRPGAVPLR